MVGLWNGKDGQRVSYCSLLFSAALGFDSRIDAVPRNFDLLVRMRRVRAPDIVVVTSNMLTHAPRLASPILLAGITATWMLAAKSYYVD